MSATTLAADRNPWRRVQWASWAVGISLIVTLFLRPTLGIHLVWDVLIPVAPALIAIAPGLWRNICPLSVTAFLPTRLRRQRRVVPDRRTASSLQLAAVIALYLIVPLRHALLDRHAAATALTLIALGMAAVVMGWLFDHKSGWCVGLCPIHPVERLYGQNPIRSFPNAHCAQCHQCSLPCPDSTPHIQPLSVQKTWQQRLSGLLMVGGFPGFIWGWFHVPDHAAWPTAAQWLQVYSWPFGGAALTIALYLSLRPWVDRKMLARIFAAAAISCYYFYRIPCLTGFGPFPGDGMLIDLRQLAPPSLIWTIALLPAVFFLWWLVWRPQHKQSWLVRPAFAKKRHR